MRLKRVVTEGWGAIDGLPPLLDTQHIEHKVKASRLEDNHRAGKGHWKRRDSKRCDAMSQDEFQKSNLECHTTPAGARMESYKSVQRSALLSLVSRGLVLPIIWILGGCDFLSISFKDFFF